MSLSSLDDLEAKINAALASTPNYKQSRKPGLRVTKPKLAAGASDAVKTPSIPISDTPSASSLTPSSTIPSTITTAITEDTPSLTKDTDTEIPSSASPIKASILPETPLSPSTGDNVPPSPLAAEADQLAKMNDNGTTEGVVNGLLSVVSVVAVPLSSIPLSASDNPVEGITPSDPLMNHTNGITKDTVVPASDNDKAFASDSNNNNNVDNEKAFSNDSDKNTKSTSSVLPWQSAKLNLDDIDDGDNALLADATKNQESSIMVPSNPVSISLPSTSISEPIFPSTLIFSPPDNDQPQHSTDNIPSEFTESAIEPSSHPVESATTPSRTSTLNTAPANTNNEESMIDRFFPVMKDTSEIFENLPENEPNDSTLSGVTVPSPSTAEDPLLAIQNELAGIVNQQPLLVSSPTVKRIDKTEIISTPSTENQPVVRIDPAVSLWNTNDTLMTNDTSLVPLFQYSVIPPVPPPTVTTSPVRINATPIPSRRFSTTIPSSSVPARLLEPTQSWSRSVQQRQEEEEQKRINRRKESAKSDAFSPLRTIANSIRPIDPTVRSYPISSATNERRSASVPPKNSRYSQIRPRVYDNLHRAQVFPQSLVPPPLLPESRYVPGNGHTRDWVAVTDKSLIMRLPETYSTNIPNRFPTDSTNSYSSQRISPFPSSQTVATQVTSEADASIATANASHPTRTRSLSVSSAVTRTSTVSRTEPPTVAVITPTVTRGRTRTRTVSSAIGPTPERHPLRKSSKQRNEEDEQERLRAQSLNLIVGARPHLRKPVFDPATQTVSYDSAETCMDRAGERLYRRAVEERERKETATKQPPPNCTFTPSLTPLAHSLGKNVPYVPKEVVEVMQKTNENLDAGLSENTQPLIKTLDRSTPSVPRYELLHASAAIQSAKKTAAALFAKDHDTSVSFRPEITVKAQRMSTDQRVKRLAQSLPPETKQDITITSNDLGSRLFAYSQVFAERREALSRSLFAKENPAQPKLNPRSLALAQRPQSAAAFSRRPVHEISPYTTPQALALRQEQIELAQCTFKPELSKSTNSVRRIRTTRSVSPSLNGGGGEGSIGSSYRNLRNDNREPVHERLLRLGQDTAIKLEIQRAIAEAKELKASTFTPVITRSSSVSRRSVSKGRNDKSTDTKNTLTDASKSDVSVRLYEEAQEIAKRLEAKRSELQRLKQITYKFTPSISETSRKLAENNPERQERCKLTEEEGRNKEEDIMLSTPARNTVSLSVESSSARMETTETTIITTTEPIVIQVSDHLWYDCAWDAVREYEHTIARTLQSIIKRELRNSIHKYRPNPRQINLLTNELLLYIRTVQPSSPRSILIFSGDNHHKTENQGIITVNNTVKNAAHQPSYLLALPSTDAHALTKMVWKTLVDYVHSHDEEKQQFHTILRQRFDLKDTTFAPRNLERYTPIIKNILQERIQQTWDRLMTTTNDNNPPNSTLMKKLKSSSYVLKLTSVNPHYAYRNRNDEDKSSSNSATGTKGLTINHNIWNELAHEHKDVPLLEEISRRIELAPCTFQPNTEPRTNTEMIPNSRPSRSTVRKAVNTDKSGSVTNEVKPNGLTITTNTNDQPPHDTVTPTRSRSSSLSSTTSSVASSISSFIATIPPTPKSSVTSLMNDLHPSFTFPTNVTNDTWTTITNEIDKEMNTNEIDKEMNNEQTKTERDDDKEEETSRVPVAERKNSSASNMTNRSTVSNHRGPGSF